MFYLNIKPINACYLIYINEDILKKYLYGLKYHVEVIIKQKLRLIINYLIKEISKITL